MADHPAVVHGIAGRRYLGMCLPAADMGAASILNAEHIIADVAGAKALRTLIAVIINLRLRMMMRRIA